MKRSPLPSLIKAVVFLIISIALTTTAPAADSDEKTVKHIAVIPFTVHSKKDLAYIQKGISQMLTSRLSWKDKLVVLPENVILQLLDQEAAGPAQQTSEALIQMIAKSTRADHVITGSITEFGGSFSLDTQIYHQTESTGVHTFFRQVNEQDQIMSAMNAIAAAINRQVFHRDVLWGAPAGESDEKSSEETARANPETLIPQIIPPTQPEKKPFWMFWENEPPPLYPDEIPGNQSISHTPPVGSPDDYSGMMEEDDEMEKESVPFWKFWKKGKPDDAENADLEYDYEDKEEVPWESSGENPDDKKPFWKIW